MEKTVVILFLVLFCVGSVVGYDSSLVDPDDVLTADEVPDRFFDNFIFTLNSEQGRFGLFGEFMVFLLVLVILYLPIRALRGGR